MDWQLVQQYKPTVLVVGFRKFSQLVSVVSPEFSPQAHIEVLDFVFEKDVTINDILQYQHADVIVSAGSNSAYLQQRIDLPVLSLEVTDLDVLNAVTTAATLQSPVKLISSGDHAGVMAALEPLLGASVEHSRYATPDEARTLVYLAVKQGYQLIVGSSYVCSLAEQENVRSLLLYSRESCRKLLQDAVATGIAERTRYLARLAEIAALPDNSVAALVMDESGDMLAYNPAPFAWLGLTGEAAILQAGRDMQDSLKGGPSTAVTVNGRACIARRLPLPEGGYVVALRLEPEAGTAAIARTDPGTALGPNAGRRLLYGSQIMSRLDKLTTAYAQTGATVLVTGESGTGKELIAREIHRRSHFHQGEFVAINCGAIPDELFESELFGFAEGAFTTSLKGGRTGLLAAAQDGVFFLDEISELPLKQQAKILRVIQERSLRPLGSNREIPLNVKFVCASNQDLARLVAEGRFRQDLFYRLNVLTLDVPPLHRRRSDILPIARWMLAAQARQYGLSASAEDILESLREPLQRYHWPGNVRELENVIERLTATMVSEGSAHLLERLPQIAPELCEQSAAARQTPGNGSRSGADSTSLRATEMKMIREALERFGGNRARTAEYLGISTTTLWRRLRGM
ncbi:MAG: sigma 54-interacting transcriptional regulator [Haliea sp.]|uniref:sigma 54-interacting transcriptional regulator n=1 Tax=Haliea sp. TaxID=1932666 RepID=UPI0032EEA84C